MKKGEKKVKVVSIIDFPHLLQKRSVMSSSELDEYYPDRIRLTVNQINKFNKVSKKEFEAICDKDCACCYGLGDSAGGVNCRYADLSGCLCEPILKQQLNCPDVKMQIRTGIFPYVADRQCKYWDLFEKITGKKFTER